MMDSENNNTSEEHFHPLSESNDELENLILHEKNENDSLTSKSYSNYRSVMSTLSDSNNSHNHPLSSPSFVSPVDSDPLLSPPQHHREFQNPNSPNADAIFTSFDGETSSNGVNTPTRSFSDGGVFSRSESLNSEYLRITVSNPVKEQENSNSIVPGSNSYVTYLITTRTNLQEFGGNEFGVRRRFKDVVTLSDRLSEAYRGFFIPPRPDKSIVESQVMQKQEFVEQRRVSLEKYLRRLADHPVIRKSDEFRVFLQVQGKLPLVGSTDVASRVLDGAVKLPKQLMGESVIAPSEVVQPAKGGRDLLRLFKELKQSMANDWGGSKPLVVEEDNAKAINSAICILVAEHKGADDASQSKTTRRIIKLPEINTIADRLRAFLGDHTWPIVQDLVEDIITVEDFEIIKAMKLCFKLLKIVLESCGAAGLVVMLSETFQKNPAWKDSKHIRIVV